MLLDFGVSEGPKAEGAAVPGARLVGLSHTWPPKHLRSVSGSDPGDRRFVATYTPLD